MKWLPWWIDWMKRQGVAWAEVLSIIILLIIYVVILYLTQEEAATR